VQRLYEFVFNKATDVDSSFKLRKVLPAEDILCSDTITLSETGLDTPCTLVAQAFDGEVLTLLRNPKAVMVKYLVCFVMH